MNYQDELLEVLKAAAKDKASLGEFLNDLLTPQEYEEIQTRWQIVKRLAKGEPQRTIARDLKIGIATVTRGSRALTDKNGGCAKMAKKLKIK